MSGLCKTAFQRLLHKRTRLYRKRTVIFIKNCNDIFIWDVELN